MPDREAKAQPTRFGLVKALIDMLERSGGLSGATHRCANLRAGLDFHGLEIYLSTLG